MPKIDTLVSSLGTGWKVVGTGTPVEETQTIPNPMASNPTAPANTPSTITQGTGRYYVVVQDPDGHQRAMFLTASSDQGTTGPGLTPTPAITGRDPAPGTRVVAGNELANLNWDQAGAIADVPAGSTTKQPSATNQLDKIDSKGNVIAPDDTTTKPVQLRDPATGAVINLVTDPAGTLHDLGNDVILVKPDGSYTKVATKPKEPSQFNVAGVGLVEYDPSKPEGSQYTTKIKSPATNDPKTEVRDGVTYQYDPDSKNWIKTDLPADVQIGYTYNDPNSDQIIFYDKSGKEVSRTTKPNYKPPVQVQPGSAPAADLISPKIPTFNPQTGALEFVDNPNQIKASEATSQLAQQLGLKVAAGSMSEKQAQDLITGAVNTMNAQTSRMTAEANQQQNITTAAGDVLANTRGNAQTGAGLIQQRLQAATGLLQNVLGLAGGGQRSGNMGGGLMNAPAGLGEALTSGIQGWTADLAGGQQTLDSAARMVQMADPSSNVHDPATQHAIGVLSQMLDKYQDVTGVPHPAVMATQAAQASAGGGMAAPSTFNPQASTAGLNAAGYPDTPEGRAAAIAAGRGNLLATPAPAPAFAAPATYGAGPPPGANYGNAVAYTGGVAPWLAQPGPSFIAPPIAPTLAPVTVTS